MKKQCDHKDSAKTFCDYKGTPSVYIRCRKCKYRDWVPVHRLKEKKVDSDQ